MKKRTFIWMFALSLLFAATANGQNESKSAPAPAPAATSANDEITVFQSVVTFADLMGFKYKDVLNRAKNGDRLALRDFLKFHATADGRDGLNHAVTCLELMPIANDENFAIIIRNLNPNLKKLLLDRLVLAQGLTTKEDLRKPISSWSPMTWAALNNQPVEGLCRSDEPKNLKKPGAQTATEPDQTKPGIDAAPAPGKPGLTPGASDMTPAKRTPQQIIDEANKKEKEKQKD